LTCPFFLSRKLQEARVQRGILRHVFVVVDLSLAMDQKDLKPHYLELTVSYLKQFVLEFFDQNPISQLGFIGTKDGRAQMLTDLSGIFE
jgi:transcription initiation factor TFIIH subunit 2